MRTLLICLFLFYVSSTSALILEGTVIDAKTARPIPFVHIGLMGTPYGTASNSTGQFIFSIKDDYSDALVRFSCIGYLTKEIAVSALLDQNMVTLEPALIQLAEVTVMPDSTLRSFLHKACDQIPGNYTHIPANFTGFFRTTLKDLGNRDNLRFVEAIIGAYKTPYSDKQAGTVKVIKSRKYISGNYFFPGFFYGGIHAVHGNDWVKARAKFLCGHKNFDYELEGVLEFQGNRVYKISFSPVENSNEEISGKFYIDTKSLAFVEIDLELTAEGLKKRSREFSTVNIKSLRKERSVKYDLFEGKHYLKSTLGSELFLDADSNIYESSYEYVTTQVKTKNTTNFPFREQVSSRYTPTIEATDYRDSDWKDYNILKLSSSVNLPDTVQGNQLFYSEPKVYKPISEKIAGIVSKFELGMDVIWLDFEVPAAKYVLKYQDLNFANERRKSDRTFGYQLRTAFQLGNKGSLFWEVSGSLDKDAYIRQNVLGGRYYLPLKTVGNQLLFNFNGGWFWHNLGYSLGKESSSGSFSFGGKNINAEEIQAYAGFRQKGIKTGAGLSYQISSLLHLEAGVNYFIPVYERDITILKEESGFFLWRKTAYDELSYESIEFYINDVPAGETGLDFSGLSLSLGVKFRF